MGRRISRIYLLALLVLGICASILALESINQNHGTQELRQSSQHQQRIRLPRRLSSRHNELASTESTKKASSSSLIGGHLRTETETISSSAKSTEKTTADEDTLLLSSAGAGKDKKKTTPSSDDDDKKTLSQQVKEGKYGLIQNELFADRPKRPGIISYSSNPEVPGDTIKNIGGLDEDEIWLAENHVLVLKGGSLPESDHTTNQGDDFNWPPIDDYKAPRRQVKIPSRPKVPPPFPIQLIEGGPIELIGTNGSTLAENGTLDFEALPGGFRGFLPGEGPYFPLPNFNITGEAPSPGGPEKKTKAEGPFFPALPPGAVIVPPPSNQTDYDDEDQSIYYPPPYSFVYPQDNSTDIPPGPLVPGIILPPPPDFFSSLNENSSKKPSRTTTKDPKDYVKRPISSTPSPSRPSYLPPRKSSTKIYKTPSVTALPINSKTASYNPKPFSRTKLKNVTFHHLQQYHTQRPTSPVPTYSSTPFVEVTTPIPVKSTTLESADKYHIQQLLGNQVTETSTEKIPWKASIVSSKAVPLITYFASSTPTSVDQPVETTPAIKAVLTTTENPIRYPSQASYYFYEETSNEEQNTPSPTPAPILFFSTTAETPPYYKLEIPNERQQQPHTQAQQIEEQKKDYYDVEMIPTQQTSSKDYNVKLIDSIVKNPQIYRYLDSGATNNQEKFETSPMRNQSPRMLHSEPLFYQSIPARPAPPRLSYFTTPKPKSYYRRPQIGDGSDFTNKPSGKSKPIYSYSFEATNYPKQSRQVLSPKPEIQIREPLLQIQQPRRQKELSLFDEYQNIQTVADQYDYEGTDQQLQTDKLLPSTYHHLSVAPTKKKKERPYYPQIQQHQQSTTISPVRDTTLAAHQQYFTKQDEQLLDEVTKEYFTMFGKKLPSTTPIYGKSSVTERPSTSPTFNDYPRQPSAFRAQNIRVHYGDQTPGPYSSLKDDMLVNYKQPLPSVEPESDYVTPQPKYRPRPVLQVASQVSDYGIPHQRFDQLRTYQQSTSPQRDPSPFVPIADPRSAAVGNYRPPRPISLEGDTAVNYKDPRPPINPDAEFIAPPAIAGHSDKSNSYFAYRLPGDGGHFYFLTPQAVGREDPNYLYSRPRGSRLVRRRRGRDGE